MSKRKSQISDGMYMVILAVNALCLIVICSPLAASFQEPKNKKSTEMSMEVPLPRYEEIHGVSGNQSDVQFVEFQAAAVVKGTNEDVLLFERLQRTHRNRMKEVMDQVVRKAKQADFQEPDLKTMRTEIRDGLNRMVEKELVDEVHFGSFRVFQTPRVIGSD